MLKILNIMICKKCGWMLEYIPRSFQEQIEENIGGQKKKGYWRCPNCNFKISSKNLKAGKK